MIKVSHPAIQMSHKFDWTAEIQQEAMKKPNARTPSGNGTGIRLLLPGHWNSIWSLCQTKPWASCPRRRFMTHETTKGRSIYPENDCHAVRDCWAVECEDQRGWIPLKHAHRGVEPLGWPSEFEIHCPSCYRTHRYVGQEVERKSLMVPSPLRNQRLHPVKGVGRTV